jgi:hypothetical protein
LSSTKAQENGCEQEIGDNEKCSGRHRNDKIGDGPIKDEQKPVPEHTRENGGQNQPSVIGQASVPRNPAAHLSDFGRSDRGDPTRYSRTT